MKRVIYILIWVLICSYNLSFAEFPAVEVYENTANNVVLILAKGEGSGSMVGAGSVISKSGIIVTNAHVICNDEKTKPLENIRVYLKPEKVTGKFRRDLVHRYEAEIIAYDTDLDLAILQAKDLPSYVGIVELADPGEIRTGEEVVAIGHPEQGGLWTLSYGRISGEISDQNSVKGKDVYQTDASVNRGNSGGPLLDRRGYMVGINTNVARMGAGNMAITGVNFAIKASVMKEWFEKQDIKLEYGKKPLDGHKQDKTRKESTGPGGQELNKKELEASGPADTVVTGNDIPEERILTEKRPYDIDDLFKETEAEMEDMMKEMREKIRVPR